MEESLKLFISYSHRDEKLQQQLIKHLAPLKSQKVIEAWHDRQIPAGAEWANEIDENLNDADIVLLLVSPDFVASNYCSNIELSTAMARHEAEAAIVIPVVLEPCDWSWLPFAKFQAFPKDALAVTSWSNQNEAFVDVATGIRKVAQEILTQRQLNFQQKKANQEKYKAKVEQVLTNGEISLADRDTLDELQESLGLTAEEAKQTEDSAYRPFFDKAEKQEKYKKTLLKYVENYPFSEDITRQLENRQRDLGLKNKDIEQIIKPILADAEVNYQERLKKEHQQQIEVEQLEQQNEDVEQIDQSVLAKVEHQKKLQIEGEQQQEVETEAEVHNKLGLNLEVQGKRAEAIGCYRKAIQIDPTFVESYLNLGGILASADRRMAAIDCYQKAIQLDPNSVRAYNNLGLALFEQGKKEEAITCYRKSLQIDPDDAVVYNNLGLALFEQGKKEEAITCYRKSLQIDPDNAVVQNNLEKVQSQGKFLGLF